MPHTVKESDIAPADQQNHLLAQTDATYRDTIGEESIDLIVTSPPYNVGMEYDGNAQRDLLSYKDWQSFSQSWLSNALFWTKPTGRLCLNVPLDKNKNGKHPVASDMTQLALTCGWKYHATIIWNEGNISRRTAWGSWKSASAPHVIAPVETILVFYKEDWKRKNQSSNDITGEEFKDWVLGMWSFPGESAKRIGHDAPFPRELPKRCIKLFSFVQDTVLDPFVGSGTTMIEAILNGRRAIGIEKEHKYCKLTCNRIRTECNLELTPSSRASQETSTASY